MPQELKLHLQDAEAVRTKRRQLGMRQEKFWSPLGVTQSGGSRYENERDIPMPVQLLLEIAYGTEKQSAKVVDYLRSYLKDSSESR